MTICECVCVCTAIMSPSSAQMDFVYRACLLLYDGHILCSFVFCVDVFSRFRNNFFTVASIETSMCTQFLGLFVSCLVVSLTGENFCLIRIMLQSFVVNEY